MGRNIQSRNPPSPRLPIEWDTSELDVILPRLHSKLPLYVNRHSFKVILRFCPYRAEQRFMGPRNNAKRVPRKALVGGRS
jgi:hypothetical protein